jgi:hypothetical protein
MNVTSLIHNRQLARLACVAVFSLGLVAAQNEDVQPAAVTVAQLAGSWTVALVGNTGCGIGTILAEVTLDSNGTGTSTNTYNNASTNPGCGPVTATGQSFVINSLSPSGSGTASLSCGASCGWTLNIQVAPAKTPTIFNLVDVTKPDNFLAGTAVRK